jgi:glycine oxidase
VNSWDAIVVGAGVIGLSLAWRLRREGLRVLIVEKGEPAREATYAAGGMIAHCDPHLPSLLLPLARASAAMYPEFVHELHDESGESPDLRDIGTIWFAADGELPSCEGARYLAAGEARLLEPAMQTGGSAYWLPEHSVDPRGLGSALVKAAKHRGVDFVTGSAAIAVEVEQGRAAGVRTAHSSYSAAAVVNCAGAWASQLQPLGLPTRPVKGQMVCVVPGPHHSGEGPLVKHVVRTAEVYIIPRSDGRILLGATVEEAGFDKRTDADTIQRLHKAAAQVAPVIGEMRMHEAWAGLRPGSPDDLPILGETAIPGYYAATGHYRDGIMLAPITARLMKQLLMGKPVDFDLQAFSPSRFS